MGVLEKTEWLCDGFNCLSKGDAEALTPIPMNMTLFGDRVFEDVIKQR